MAYIKMSFYSQSLGMNTSLEISMPDNLSAENSPYVLYLLHGLTDDNSIWTRWSRVDRYAAGKNMVIVMPCGYRGFYTDLKIGYKYFSYLSQDIPQMLKSIFKINPPREKTFAAGNSMGGYGAVKLGLRCV